MEKISPEQANITAFFKKKPSDKIWWIDGGNIGEHLFSFDKRTIFNLFADYPWKLTDAERETFVKENPFWVDFFADRLEKLK